MYGNDSFCVVLAISTYLVTKMLQCYFDEFAHIACIGRGQQKRIGIVSDLDGLHVLKSIGRAVPLFFDDPRACAESGAADQGDKRLANARRHNYVRHGIDPRYFQRVMILQWIAHGQTVCSASRSSRDVFCISAFGELFELVGGQHGLRC